jgi:hypothetical protein
MILLTKENEHLWFNLGSEAGIDSVGLLDKVQSWALQNVA